MHVHQMRICYKVHCNPLAISGIYKSFYILTNHDLFPATKNSSFGLYVKKGLWSSTFGSEILEKKDYRRGGEKDYEKQEDKYVEEERI